MPSAGGFQLTEDDVQILTHVFQYRTLNVEHLALLTGRLPKQVHRRLLPMTERRYLARAEPPFKKHLYFVGSAGVDVLVDRGIAPKELALARLRHHELKPLFLDHLGMIVDIHACLDLATRGVPIGLVSWRQGRELWDTTTEGLPVQPDGFFTLEDRRRAVGKNRRHFFLEADGSTMAHERFQSKLEAYWKYLAEGRFSARYDGMKSFRVVTVTLTDARARGLSEAAEAVIPATGRHLFLFASLEQFSLTRPAAVLEEVFQTAADWRTGVQKRLMPEQTASQLMLTRLFQHATTGGSVRSWRKTPR